MIRKLRHKLIFVAMGSLLLVLLLILGTVNYLNYRSVVAEADRILTLLTENGGVFPEDYTLQKEFFLTGKTSELPYTSRFFSVTLDSAGSVRSVNTEKPPSWMPKPRQTMPPAPCAETVPGDFWLNSGLCGGTRRTAPSCLCFWTVPRD